MKANRLQSRGADDGPLIGGAGSIGWVGLKALLLYLTAVFGFPSTHRRTLAEMSAFDFAAAVAVGSVRAGISG